MILVRMERVGRNVAPGPLEIDCAPEEGDRIAEAIHRWARQWLHGSSRRGDFNVSVTCGDNLLDGGDVFIEAGRFGRGKWEVLGHDG